MSTSETRDLATWGALLGLSVMAICLLGLMAMVAPHVFGIALILFGFLGFGALHYLLWGWWLRPTLTTAKEEEEQDPDSRKIGQ